MFLNSVSFSISIRKLRKKVINIAIGIRYNKISLFFSVHLVSFFIGNTNEKWRKNKGANVKPTKIIFTPNMACIGFRLLIIISSPIFQVANERTKHAKSLWAIFFGLLERTTRHKMRFMVNASAAGRAKIFTQSPFLLFYKITYFTIIYMINKLSIKFKSVLIVQKIISLLSR